MIQTVNSANFEQQVLLAALPVLVEFGAVWCAPCKRLEPILDALAAEWRGRAQVLKADVDIDPDLALRFQVMSVPTILMFKQGREMARLVGLQSRERIIEKLSQLL